MCVGSNPAGGTLHEVPKDPGISGNAEAGVFAFVQACAARSGRMSGSVDEAWMGSWSIAAGGAPRWSRADLPLVIVVLAYSCTAGGCEAGEAELSSPPAAGRADEWTSWGISWM